MIFDLYMPQYTLIKEDNSGPDDSTQDQQQNQQQQQSNQNQEDQNQEDQNPEEKNQDEDEYNMTDPDEEENPQEDQNQEDQNPEEENQDEDEYAMTDPDEDGEDDTDNNQDDNTDATDNDDTVDENDPSAKLKELEKSIFDQLSPELQQAKTIELKKLYTITYEKCQSIIDTLGTIEKEPSKVKVYDYILNSLLDLQKYINDYLANIFDSKTYIENMTELQKYLAILDTVNGVFEEMSKSVPDDK